MTAPATTQRPPIVLWAALWLIALMAVTVVAIVAVAASFGADELAGLRAVQGLGLVGAMAALLAALGSIVHRLGKSDPQRTANRIERALARLGHPALAALALAVPLLLLVVATDLAGKISPRRSIFVLYAAVLSAVLAVPVLAGSRARVAAAWSRAKGPLAGLSLALLVTAVVGGTYLAVEEAGIGDRVAAAVNPPRLPRPVSDPSLDANAFWSEFEDEMGGSRWLPYLYYRTAPFAGKFHTIDSSGVRKSWRPSPPPAKPREVWFFGGSTVWGYGARDDHTIPSLAGRFLHDRGFKDVVVTNYGEMAYTATQDMVLFIRRLQMGHKPELAVFYQGLNEFGSWKATGYAGLTAREFNRIQEFNLGGRLREQGRKNGLAARLPLLVAPFPPHDKSVDGTQPGLDVSLVSPGTSIADVADIWFATVETVKTVAAAHGVKVLFVWQPSPWVGKPLAPLEKERIDDQRRTWPGSVEAAGELDQVVRARLQALKPRDVIDLSRLFEHESKMIFFDPGHATEEGNARIAEALLPAMAARLGSR